jgi:Uma2 family endonuclease
MGECSDRPDPSRSARATIRTIQTPGARCVSGPIRVDPRRSSWQARHVATRPIIRRAPLTRSFTRAEYDRLIDLGFLDEDEPIELLGGEMVVKEPQAGPHATAVYLVQQALQRAFGPGWLVRAQLPVALDDDSEPEPDACVVRGAARDYRDAHPRRPVLVVEVADNSLARDRGRKGSLYARAGVNDYWIVNLRERALEVYREPIRSARAAHGWRYARVERFGPKAVVSPMAAPRARVPVADLLP